MEPSRRRAAVVARASGRRGSARPARGGGRSGSSVDGTEGSATTPDADQGKQGGGEGGEDGPEAHPNGDGAQFGMQQEEMMKSMRAHMEVQLRDQVE